MKKKRAVLEQDLKAWQEGFAAGEALKAGCPYPTLTIEALSWQSGYIEGKAERPKSCLKASVKKLNNAPEGKI
jgi:hypothetical protein